MEENITESKFIYWNSVVQLIICLNTEALRLRVPVALK